MKTKICRNSRFVFFLCFILMTVTGCAGNSVAERNIVRGITDGVLGLPPSRIIGTEYGYTASGQGDTEIRHRPRKSPQNMRRITSASSP